MKVKTGSSPYWNPPSTPSSRVSHFCHRSNLAQEFCKGIKHDKAHYLALKNERGWDDWKWRIIATMHAHGCENIADPTYSPSDPDEKLLFTEQNKYMYDVFLMILQTPM